MVVFIPVLSDVILSRAVAIARRDDMELGVNLVRGNPHLYLTVK